MRKLFLFAIFAAFIAMTSLLPALDAPKWIGAFPVQKKVGLKWQPVEGAEAYVIYRAVGDQPAAKLSEIRETQYFDETVEPGESYQYTITAVAAGAEGAASDARSVTMPGVKLGSALYAPVWVGGRYDQGNALLRWQPMKDRDIVAYNLQRSEISGGPYELVSSTQENKHLERRLVPGRTYYYVLTALDANFNESPRSEELAYTHGDAIVEDTTIDLPTAADLVPIPLEFEFEITKADGLNLNMPADVVVSSSGEIYVVDALNTRIAVFDSRGAFKFTFGRGLTSDKQDNPPEGCFQLPFTMAIDAQDNVYVTDIENGDIQQFDKSGKFLKRFPTRLIEGERKFCPAGLEVLADGSLLVSDRDNARLLKLNPQGEVVWQVGSYGAGDGQFNAPNEVCINSKGQIYVVDVLNQRIQIFDGQGSFVGKFGSIGRVAGTFARPKGLFVDAKDQIWIADGLSNALQVYGPDNKPHSAIGGLADKRLAFDNPRGIVVSGSRVYVVDRNHGRVVVMRMI